MEQSTRSDVTRRRYVRAGASVVGGGALAGCSDLVGGRDGTPSKDGSQGPYTVEMAPMGEVAFESVPERVFTVLSHHADMALALGRGDDVTAVLDSEYTDSMLNAFTARLDGVTVDWADLYSSWNPSKEKLYALDSDVHLADPAVVLTMNSWEQSDIEDVRETIAPWFGNTYSDQHREPPAAYADGYRYYTLWEIFEKVAAVFQEQERYRALADERSAMRSTIESNLPPESDRPSVAMALPSTNDEGMWVYDVNTPGYHTAHTSPFGARDAFEGMGVSNGDKIDYEALLEADPDVLLALGGVVDAHDMVEFREQLSADPVASEVAAVRNDRVHAQGTRHQGPLVNLFQLEMTAKQLFPDRFGAWPTYESGPYPEVPEDERLFDRQRVAAVINGAFDDA